LHLLDHFLLPKHNTQKSCKTKKNTRTILTKQKAHTIEQTEKAMKLTATSNVNTTKQGRRHNAKDAETQNGKRGAGESAGGVGGGTEIPVTPRRCKYGKTEK